MLYMNYIKISNKYSLEFLRIHSFIHVIKFIEDAIYFHPVLFLFFGFIIFYLKQSCVKGGVGYVL